MLIQADARLIPLRDQCVQCCVTSPPYFGLRDYGHPQQIGLQKDAAEYVDELVGVFREVRRVLADDGVLWLNLGDTYNAYNGNAGPSSSISRGRHDAARPDLARGHGLLWKARKPKDLLGIPWMVAFALQADGWYLRSDIIWSKPNPMPESVTDRPTKAHEYLFLFAKSERYFYDAQAIAEPVSVAMLEQMEDGYEGLGLKDYESAGVQNPSSVKARIIANAKARYKAANIPGQSPHGYTRREGGTAMKENAIMRNRRTVWSVPTKPYVGSHFATMPEKLVEPCILAGSRFGDRILDPFMGSGTVGAVAERLGRQWVGLDLNPAYHQLAKQRTAQRGLRFDAGDGHLGDLGTDRIAVQP